MAQELLQSAESNQFKPTIHWKVFALILLFLLIVSCVLLVIFVLKPCHKCNLTPESVVSSDIEIIDKQKQEVANSDEDRYLIQEFNLLNDSNSLAKSKLFGFQFGKFHQDWECLNGGLKYTSDGVTINCRQKQCSLSEGAEFSTTVQIDRSKECATELENREFAQSVLPSFKIDASPVYLEIDQELSDIENFSPNKSTPNGFPYSFKVIESDDQRQSGWISRYEILFYSPKEISNTLSMYSGTLYGSDEIYTKFQIVVDVYEVVDPEKKLSEEKFLNLAERMIDSIKFLDQPSN